MAICRVVEVSGSEIWLYDRIIWRALKNPDCPSIHKFFTRNLSPKSFLLVFSFLICTATSAPVFSSISIVVIFILPTHPIRLALLKMWSQYAHSSCGKSTEYWHLFVSITRFRRIKSLTSLNFLPVPEQMWSRCLSFCPSVRLSISFLPSIHLPIHSTLALVG